MVIRKLKALSEYVLQWGRASKSADMTFDDILNTMHSIASMGPRFKERGYNRPQVFIQTLYESFNGAALQRARICFYLFWYVAFQGASMGPRFKERGYFLLTSTPTVRRMLQWGRASKSADIRCRNKYWNTNRYASMGPRFKERGYIICARRTRSGPGCFNGAALQRARI